MDAGWQRFLPSAAISVLPEMASSGSISRERLNELLAGSKNSPEGLDSSVWEPLEEYTDESLAELDDRFEGTSFARQDSRPQTAAEVNEEERISREEKIDELAGFSQHLGLPPTRTIGDLLDFMVAAGVVRLEDGEYSINPQAPLPGEVLPLSDERRQTEDGLRWNQIHEEFAQSIIRLFRPGSGVPVNSISTSLAGLASTLEVEEAEVREGLSILLGEGDFVASGDPQRLESDEILTLSVDWDAFNSSRFSVRFVEDPSDGEV